MIILFSQGRQLAELVKWLESREIIFFLNLIHFYAYFLKN